MAILTCIVPGAICTFRKSALKYIFEISEPNYNTNGCFNQHPAAATVAETQNVVLHMFMRTP